MSQMLMYEMDAELAYHRERIAKDVSHGPSATRRLARRLSRHHRPRLDVVQPYGDVRA